MKKTVIRIMALVLCLASLFGAAACKPADTPAGSPSPGTSSNPPAPAQKIEIIFTLWGDPAEQEVTQKNLDVFNASQDRIHVTALQIGRDEYLQTLQTRASSGTMPDCGMVAEDSVIGWARDGLLMQYDIFAGQASKPLDSLAFKDNGKVVAYSSCNEILALWYNRAMFDAAGVPYPPTKLEDAWTWDQFIEVAKKLTLDGNGKHPGDAGFDKNNIVQYGCYANQYTWQLEVWALSNGGRFFSEDGKKIVFDDAAIEALQKVFDLHLVHNVAPFIDGTEDAGFSSSIGAGNVAMATEGQWAVGFRDGTLDYGVAVLPYMKTKANISTAGPTAVFAGSKNPEAAAEFLRWYNDEDNNFATIEAGWWMPARMNWYTDEALLKKWIDDVEVRKPLTAEDYRNAIVKVALDSGVTKSTCWYYTPRTTEVYNILRPALVEAINGNKTVKQVIDSVRAAMEGALAS